MLKARVFVILRNPFISIVWSVLIAQFPGSIVLFISFDFIEVGWISYQSFSSNAFRDENDVGFVHLCSLKTE